MSDGAFLIYSRSKSVSIAAFSRKVDRFISRPTNMRKRSGRKAYIIKEIWCQDSKLREIFPMRGNTINGPERITFHDQWARTARSSHITLDDANEFTTFHKKMSQTGTAQANRAILKWFWTKKPIPILLSKNDTSILTFKVLWFGASKNA